MAKQKESYLSQDRKRIIFGLPWSFTRYFLQEEKLIVRTGLINQTEEEIRLYRIMDITLKLPLGQRLWGLGTIHLCTADRTAPELDILRIKNARQVKDMLSDLVEKERTEKRIAARELMGGMEMDGEDDHLL